MDLKVFGYKLISAFKGGFDDSEHSSFTDLTPSDKADKDGTYSKAITFALENSRVKNIALTGPYGSGKSSIIRTYEKNNSKYRFMNISLASFKEDDHGAVDISLIERSILQQMLYGADANKLPYSRFKRISTPRHPILKSLAFVFWIIVIFYLYLHRHQLHEFEYNTLSWYAWCFFFSYTVSIPVLIISDIYKASFGISIKKISLKNAEFETAESSDNSILNRHVDEIIYFFEQTKYNVVVIEDLDRFGNPEIFVKLREINKLINDNQNAREIKFLYALKDDMFAHKNRAKFFDFIIPVVPIINSSNSLDKMQERLKKHDFAKNIDTQFLREVSLYIDDLRLIHNIFNEFEIYYELLKSANLDVKKLLAMMIYKNVYPNDFENLHHGKGVLFDVCNKRDEYLTNIKDKLKDQITSLERDLDKLNSEKLRSIRELIASYVGYIVAHPNQPVMGIVVNNQNIQFSQLTTFEQFKPLLTEQNIQLWGHYNQGRLRTNQSFVQFEADINPGEKFLSRKENIENNLELKKLQIEQEIRSLEKEISDLSLKQLSQLLQSGNIEINESNLEYGETGGRLLTYLVKNGYIDENYYLYISNFHEGRLSKNDRDYLLTIRNFNHPAPNQKIDTPKEVCANMREEDFSRGYVLNVDLIDYFIEFHSLCSKYLDSALSYMSINFEFCEEFLIAYFNKGRYVDDLIHHLSKKWPELASAAISSKHAAEIISYIIRFVDSKYISNNMNSDNILGDYLSEHGYLVLASDLQLPDKYDVLKKLNVRFHNLSSLENNNSVIEFCHDESLYEITIDNVSFVLQKFSDPSLKSTINPETENYTSIKKAGSDRLTEYIENNILTYINNIFLTLPSNCDESEASIKTLINNNSIDVELKKSIISKQKLVFDTFDGLPESIWSHAFLEEKVTISWKNISTYLKCDGCDSNVVNELLRREHIVKNLSSINISKEGLSEEDSKLLSRFLINNNDINDSDYCKLITCIPWVYSNFPDSISETKHKHLVNANKVKLTDNSFNFIGDNIQLLALLISRNIDIYLKEKEKYPLNDEARELLLSSEISEESKVNISYDITPNSVENSQALSQLISNVLVSNEVDYSRFDDVVLSSVIINSQSTSDAVKILIKCIPNWNEEQTFKIIQSLPEPFCEISAYGKRPKLELNTENLELANILATKGFISSIKEKPDFITINTFKSNDHSE
ncbi:hypothetical protein [Methylotuvimicrobium sp.]|uniref:YobI family P-loop NTPase n=1 Tax=Methylotuvimicrobium sp. TaxID=2822413 RepID=UPI003D65E210